MTNEEIIARAEIHPLKKDELPEAREMYIAGAIMARDDLYGVKIPREDIMLLAHKYRKKANLESTVTESTAIEFYLAGVVLIEREKDHSTMEIIKHETTSSE